MKYIKIVLFILIGTGLVSCNSETPLPDENYFLSKTWKMVEVLVNGEQQQYINLNNYRLILNSDQNFTRINFDGNESAGTREQISGGNQLILFAGAFQEERYLIIDLQVRRMELQLTQNNRKFGDLEFRFILETVRP